ncbi:MAG: single-stranded-DNA-specific exonuclease RecJ [Alphaproteobacteria bacterium]|nr:MAG: single-stranded-DNA-specific exonuclease RecJ [Alphaproteobacteria bacterium]
MAQQTGLAEPLCRILTRLGVPAAAAEDYLEPSLRKLMPDPSSLRDMDVAAERVGAAVLARAPVALFADYDVDGAASAALMLRWLRALGQDATLYIPDRLSEGYGPNVPAMRQLAEDHRLILCLDCGTATPEPIAVARAAGADVVVLDHHLAPDALPHATALVNPNRHDEDGALGALCAAGVVFLLLVAANRFLRRRGVEGPDLLELLDLVALATVADVAPLTGLNRAFVRQGLKVMARRERPGLAALSDVARLRRAPNAYHLGFALGPRINAGGRIGSADLGARLLATDHAGEAQALAARLDALNRERQAIEAAVLEAARAQVEARGSNGPLVWAAGEGWHPGVVGIVAARLAELFDRPAIVIGLSEAGGKGSGRSRPGIDLGSAVAKLTAEGLLRKGGGHPMAAGLELDPAALQPAMERLAALLAAQDARPARRELTLDGLLSPAGLSVDLLEEIARAGPFGAAAPAPRFAFPALRVAHARTVGNGHLQLRCTDAGGATLQAIAFGAAGGPLAQLLQPGSPRPVHLAGRVEIDEWQGRRQPKLHVEDAAPAS